MEWKCLTENDFWLCVGSSIVEKVLFSSGFRDSSVVTAILRSKVFQVSEHVNKVCSYFRSNLISAKIEFISKDAE